MIISKYLDKVSKGLLTTVNFLFLLYICYIYTDKSEFAKGSHKTVAKSTVAKIPLNAPDTL